MKAIKLKKRKANFIFNLKYNYNNLSYNENCNNKDDENFIKDNIFLTDYKKEEEIIEIKDTENKENSKTRNKNSISNSKNESNYKIVFSNNNKNSIKNIFKDKNKDNINHHYNNLIKNSKDNFNNIGNK